MAPVYDDADYVPSTHSNQHSPTQANFSYTVLVLPSIVVSIGMLLVVTRAFAPCDKLIRATMWSPASVLTIAIFTMIGEVSGKICAMCLGMWPLSALRP